MILRAATLAGLGVFRHRLPPSASRRVGGRPVSDGLLALHAALHGYGAEDPLDCPVQLLDLVRPVATRKRLEFLPGQQCCVEEIITRTLVSRPPSVFMAHRTQECPSSARSRL
jgi:hypothetical protein